MELKGPPDSDGSVQDLHRRLSAMEEECVRLRRENERLRKLLGLPAETAESAAQSEVGPRLLRDAEPLPAVDSNSPATKKIALFRTLFRGRQDVYPILWVNERTGKRGYVPAVKGGWIASRSQQKEYLPVTNDVIQQHLSGEITIGVYPLLKDDTCWFLVCDFDGDDWVEDAGAYRAACNHHHVPAYLERSRSGDGGHVWIFFSNPMPAVQARRLGASLLREAMLTRADLDLSSYDRFFPNQDYLPKGGFGNLIALPLQKKRRELGHTEFLDPATLLPWPDQWAFLSQIQRLSPERVDALLEKIPPVTVGLGSVGPLKKPPGPVKFAPRNIRCVRGAVLSIEKSGIPPALLSEIKHLASLQNPVFYERQKLRFSTYRTPRFIRCYDQDTTHIHLPRGVLEELTRAVEAVGSRLSIQDQRSTPQKVPLTFHGKLASFQEEAVQSVLTHELGVLVAPPGSGKTVMGCYIAAARKLPTLILVHRKPLLDQWRVQLMNLLGLSTQEIGQIGAGKNKRTFVVDLAMIQSLKDMENAESFFSRYGLIIVDECHHLPAYSFESCVKKAPVRFILGLTATPYRRDGLQDIIMMQCGPIRYHMARQSGAQGDLRLELLNRETRFCFETQEGTPIQDVFRALVHDEERSRGISRDILAALEEGRRCLVLSQWKEHCRILADLLLSQGKKPFLLEGGLRKKSREALFEAIRNISPQEELLVIATGQYLGEGFDCPQLDTLFLIFPVSFKGRLIQYTGRLMRPSDGKSTVRVYDYADVQVPVLKKMHAKRLRTYQTLG